jgi:5'-deoxynucleotidase YfbR-like HD superfamily hydrolase
VAYGRPDSIYDFKFEGGNMKALAQAVVHAFVFLELSDDEAVDSDAAVDAMEMLAADLQECSEEEKAALEKAVSEELKAQMARKAPKKVLDFYKNFMENLGLEDKE